jgi:hypothetical protein
MPMSLPSGHDETERQADKQANVMKDQLRKEVALWNAGRDDASARQVADFSVPATVRPALPPAKRKSRAKPAAVSPPKPDGAPRKPFSMSFDGVSDAEHINYMIARGAR